MAAAERSVAHGRREKSLNVGYGGETCNLNYKQRPNFLYGFLCIYMHLQKRNCSGSPWLDDADLIKN